MRRTSAMVAAAVALVLALAAQPSPAQQAPPRFLPAVVEKDLDVSGAWTLAADLTVKQGATLRFLPGATIAIDAKDASAGGEFRDRIEILVRGRIVVDGTPAEPVVLGTPASPGPWQGIVLASGRDRSPDSAFRGLVLRSAYDGVVVSDGSPRFEGCLFERCSNGIACGTIWGDDAKRVERAATPTPEIVRCAFRLCGSGVFVESAAAPEIVRCLFVECTRGVGNDRRWTMTYPVRSTGARVDRALFLRTTVAVGGPSIVENSVFHGNGTVLAVSAFHSVYSQQVDRIAWRRNVLWQNRVACDGESDLGTENVFADPALDSLPPPGWTIGPPEGETAPPEGSPLRGFAVDGGDCGPWGRGPSGRAARRWMSAPRAVRRLLVLGPPGRLDVKNLPKSAPAAAGERVGDAWWAAFDVSDDGLLDRAALQWPDDVPVVAAVAWDGTGATEAEVNVDGKCTVWASGRGLPVPSQLQRSGSRGVVVPLPGADDRGVVVWWTSGDVSARLGAAVHGAAASYPPTAPGDLVADAAADPIRYGPKQVGFRMRVPYHWADVRKPGVSRLRTATGDVLDLAEHGLAVTDARGTLRADLPAGTSKAGARIVIDGLRDAWGRVLGGQPLEIPAEPGP